MERESNPMEALCRSGCGFYGNPATDGLCSVCFKEALKKKQQPPVSAPSGVSAASFAPAPARLPASPAPAPTASPPPDADRMDRGLVNPLNDDQPNSINIISSLRNLAAQSDLKMELSDCDGNSNTEPSTHQPGTSSPAHPDSSLEERERESGSTSGSVSSGEQEEVDCSDKDPSKDKKKKNRCAVCRKKVGLTGFECRCGGLFCSVHRYSDKHDCTFDYREMGAQEIRRNNPVVVGEKIQKI